MKYVFLVLISLFFVGCGDIEVGQCFKHVELNTVAKVQSIQQVYNEPEIQINYYFASLDNFEENSRVRSKSSFEAVYKTKVDCSKYDDASRRITNVNTTIELTDRITKLEETVKELSTRIKK